MRVQGAFSGACREHVFAPCPAFLLFFGAVMQLTPVRCSVKAKKTLQPTANRSSNLVAKNASYQEISTITGVLSPVESFLAAFFILNLSICHPERK